MTDVRNTVLLVAFLAGVLLCGRGPGAAGTDDDHAVILLYHHVGDDTPASTSVTPQAFDAHLDFLEDNGYSILPLADIIGALTEARPLPPKSVAISFDDGYVSILSAAMPRLSRRGWPFTVFVSTDAIDQGYMGFMSWDDLRTIEANGGTIANHSATHAHLVRQLEGETLTEWRRRVTGDLEAAEERLQAELDRPARRLLAWPYGEFNSELEQLAMRLGYVAFGQQSGPAGHDSNPHSLPRFPMATGFAEIDGLAEKLRTRPLPVTVLSPADRILATPAIPPRLTLQVGPGPYRLEALQCFVAGQAPAIIEHRADRIVVTARAPIPPGRGKFNCTAPSTAESGVYYWYSYLWLQPGSDGRWYEE